MRNIPKVDPLTELILLEGEIEEQKIKASDEMKFRNSEVYSQAPESQKLYALQEQYDNLKIEMAKRKKNDNKRIRGMD